MQQTSGLPPGRLLEHVEKLTRGGLHTGEPLLLSLLKPSLQKALRQELLLSLAIAAARRLNSEFAHSHFQQALQVDPQRHYGRLKYADFLLSQQQFAEVLNLLRAKP